MLTQMTQLHDNPISDRSVLKLTSVQKRRVAVDIQKKIYNYTKQFDCVYNDFSNKQRRVANCAGVFPAVLEGSYQYFRPHHPRLRSIYIERM